MTTILESRLIRDYQTKASVYDPVKGHTGEDRAYNYEMLPCPISGTVLRIVQQKQMGKVLYLRHETTKDIWVFAHLSKFLYGLGDSVKRRDGFVVTGNTGTITSGAHLHYECITQEPVNAEDVKMTRKLFEYTGYNTDPEKRLRSLYKEYNIDPLTLQSMDSKIPIQPWAAEAFEWLWSNSYATKSDRETEDFQRQVLINYRINNG